jgi:hypothetical protein
VAGDPINASIARHPPTASCPGESPADRGGDENRGVF